jgi:hypothetical protein
LTSYNYITNSSYYSRIFYTSEGSTKAKVSCVVSQPNAQTNSKFYISPDNSKTWRSLVKTKTNEKYVFGNIGVVKEEEFEYEFKLNNPKIIESSTEIGGGFNIGSVSYIISTLDSTGNEVFMKNEDGTYTPHIVSVSSVNSKIRLKVNIDSLSSGFRIYRQIGTGNLIKVFDSLASTTCSTGIGLDDSIINVVSTKSFPNSGIIKIENEFIKYSSKTETSFLNCARGFRSTASIHEPTNIELYNYSDITESVYDGRKPKLNSNSEFEIIDNNLLFAETTSFCPVTRDQNNSIVSPQSLKLRIDMISDNKNTNSLNTLICTLVSDL